MNTTKHILLALASSTLASQAVININLPGSTTTDGWDRLVNSRLSGYGGYPGASPWPAPITPNVTGSASTAVFNKTSGNGYFGTSSFYDGGFVGNLEISSTSVMPNLATLVFQIDMGANSFTNSPTLLINGNTFVTPIVTMVTEGDYTFSFDALPAPTENHVFQWDLTGIGPISSYAIQWSTSIHTTIYELQTISGSEFVTIPEPSSAVLLGLTLPLLFLRKRNH